MTVTTPVLRRYKSGVTPSLVGLRLGGLSASRMSPSCSHRLASAHAVVQEEREMRARSN